MTPPRRITLDTPAGDDRLRYPRAVSPILPKPPTRRHGLEPEGVISRLTLAQLNVTPAQRVRQIELTLERLRRTLLPQGRRMVVVNVPEFILRTYMRDQFIHIDTGRTRSW